MASRESFSPIVNNGGYSGSGNYGNSGGAGSSHVSSAIRAGLVTYICASCAAPNVLSKGDPVRCKECGHRVLYKQRTKRMVQFEAR